LASNPASLELLDWHICQKLVPEAGQLQQQVRKQHLVLCKSPVAEQLCQKHAQVKRFDMQQFSLPKLAPHFTHVSPAAAAAAAAAGAKALSA
jgi:hypothetical protein